MEILKPHLVNQLCLLLLAKANGHHFHQTTFVWCHKHRMGLDTVNDNDAVCLRRMAVDLDNMAFGGLSDDLGLHGADDRTTTAFLCYTQCSQHIALPLCCGAGMAAHSGDNKGVCSMRETEAYHGMHDSTKIGDAAAATGNGNRLDAMGKVSG